jgi:hypothetical protein
VSPLQSVLIGNERYTILSFLSIVRNFAVLDGATDEYRKIILNVVSKNQILVYAKNGSLNSLFFAFTRLRQ